MARKGQAHFLFCFGMGYTARALARRLRRDGWQVSGTTRQDEPEAGRADPEHFTFRRDHALSGEALAALNAATHVLVSVPPDAEGDPVLDMCRNAIAESPRIERIGYLSSTAVYGDSDGSRVDEDSPLRGSSVRARKRAEAETQWQDLGDECRKAIDVFRLAGIYGPGRSAFDRLRRGTAVRIDRPGHRFNRIHVDDIATTVAAAIGATRPGAIYNISDDEPAEPEKVIAFAANLLGIEPPAIVGFEEARQSMSPMALSFWEDNRFVDNGRIHTRLGVRLAHPTFREGLRAILAAEAPD